MLFVHGFIILATVIFVILKKLPVRTGGLLIFLSLIGILQLICAEPAQAIVTRPAYDETPAEYTLYFQDGVTDDRTEFSISVAPVTYTKAQLDAMAEEVFEELSKVMPGENAGTDEVSESLTLCDALSGYPFQITWASENQELVCADGTLHNEELTQPVICRLTAELAYENYIASQDFYVYVVPKTLTAGEEQICQLTRQVEAFLETQKQEDEITLPVEFSGGLLYGSIPDAKATLLWPVLGLIWIFWQRARRAEDERQQEKRRRQHLEYMYPDFVNQIALYLSAGMTIRMAMAQIMAGLENEKGEAKQELCRELASMFCGLDSGLSEQQVYRDFGTRCNYGGYRKLMSLMVQTILVGGKGLFARLEELEADAFIQRKEYAKVRGEEASTKLLIPMVILLAVVMLLFIVPGFYSMGM